MTTPQRSDERILAEIRRLRHVLERRKLTRVQAALTDAEREIEMLRAQLQEAHAKRSTAEPS